MKSILWVVSVVLGVAAFSAPAAEKPAKKLEAIQAELKPLRLRAYEEKDVLAAKAKLDAAYGKYWDAVRAAMIRLEPSKKPQIEEEVALRKQLNPVRPPAGKKPAKTEKAAKP